MINFIFSPLKALYSRKLYREVSRASVGRGFFYLSYLALLYMVGVTAFLLVSVKPSADNFIGWLEHSLPEMTFTREGVVTNVKQPFSLVYPPLGTLLVIDTTKEMPDTEELRKSFFFITKTKLYVSQNNQRRIVDVIPQGEKALSQWKDFTLTGPFTRTIYKILFPFFFVIIIVFAFLGFFIWKLVAALFYSLLALAINLFGKQKLSYPGLLNISFFALTPITLLQWLQLSFLKFPFRLNFLWALLITTLFLSYAILGTQSQEESA